MNKTFISGNLTKEPETVAPQGSEYTLIKFGIANNDERRKGPSGEWEDVTSFFDLQYWTKNPRVWLQRLKKGVGVMCEGRAKQERWQDNDGGNRSKIIFTVDKFPLILASKESPSVPSAPSGATITPPPVADKVRDEEDIPF